MTIRELINAAGTLQSAAQIACVHRTTIYAWLRGDGRPDWIQFVSLCRATGADPMTITDDMQQSGSSVNN